MVYHVGYYSDIFHRNLIDSLFCHLTVNGNWSHVYISVTAFKISKSVLWSCNLRYANFAHKNPVEAIVITINLRLGKKSENTKQCLLMMWQSTCKRTFYGEMLEPVTETGAKTVPYWIEKMTKKFVSRLNKGFFNLYLLLTKITTGQIIRAPTVATLPALWDFIVCHDVVVVAN